MISVNSWWHRFSTDVGDGELLQAEALARPLHVVAQGLVQRIVHVDQHRVIVLGLEKRLDLVVELGEQRRVRPGAFDFEETGYAVPMAVQVAALVVQLFVAVSGVELVLLSE